MEPSLSDHILGIAHIGIPVINAENAVEEYRSLGFCADAIYEIPGGSRKVAFISKCDITIELYESAKTNYYGTVDHIAYEVADIEAAFEAAEKLNCKFCGEGIGHMSFPDYSCRFFTIEMSNGEHMEFNQNTTNIRCGEK